jgi:hypothetical protein
MSSVETNLILEELRRIRSAIEQLGTVAKEKPPARTAKKTTKKK